MYRKHLALIAALVLAMSGTGHALSTPPATQLSIIRDAPQCGGTGFSMHVLPFAPEGFGCVHTAGDAFDPYASARAMATGRPPASAKVPCYGDGQTGPRVHMIYAYHQGLPNRSAAVAKQLRTQMAPRMQAVINAQGMGEDLGIRFLWTKGCGAIELTVLKVPVSVQNGTDPRDPGGQLSRMAQYLDSKGFNRDDRKYQVLWDGWNIGACGIAYAAGALGEDRGRTPLTSTPLAPLGNGLPALTGHTDVSGQLGVGDSIGLTKYSLVFNRVGSKTGPSCFSAGVSSVTTQLHELFHSYGAVQRDAPHANDTGHCDDAPSVMCPGDLPGYGGGISNKICAKVLVETLDCGMDDYWNPNPRPGSYLSTHLNVAKSQYFGPQPADSLTPLPL